MRGTTWNGSAGLKIAELNTDRQVRMFRSWWSTGTSSLVAGGTTSLPNTYGDNVETWNGSSLD